jgi:hypothetical protein
MRQNGRFGLVPRLALPGWADVWRSALPRISCGTWWLRLTSCAFLKGAHAVLSSAAWQEIRVRALHPWRSSPCHFSLNLPQASLLLGMTKGRGAACMDAGCWTKAFFITLGGPQAHKLAVEDVVPQSAEAPGVCSFAFAIGREMAQEGIQPMQIVCVCKPVKLPQDRGELEKTEFSAS